MKKVEKLRNICFAKLKNLLTDLINTFERERERERERKRERERERERGKLLSIFVSTTFFYCIQIPIPAFNIHYGENFTVIIMLVVCFRLSLQ